MSVASQPFVSTALGIALLVGIALPSAGCGRREPEHTTYYDRKIAPIVLGACARSATGSRCHVTADEHGNALGNLDVSSYDMLRKRRDLLTNYGPYDMPQLLAKVVPSFALPITSWDGTTEVVTTDIPHGGGSLLEPTAVEFTLLEQWLQNGATFNNVPPSATPTTLAPCTDRPGQDPLFNPDQDPTSSDYPDFVSAVNGYLSQNCAAGNCHGSAANPFFLSCGQTPAEVRWNYFSASDYASGGGNELLTRTLAGGTFHEGGAFFESTTDPEYEAISQWATQKGEPSNIPSSAGFTPFAQRVQPMLAKKGCLLLGCHSPPAFNDLRFNAGSNGRFSLATTRHNYLTALTVVALEAPSANASRLVRKNLPPGAGGVLHRGGALFASGGSPERCDLNAALTGPLDEQDPYCVVAAWIQTERTERLKSVPPLSGILYVRRSPTGLPDSPQDYDVYKPGADLRLFGATIAAGVALTASGADKSMLGGCGLDAASADVRRPQVSWDGQQIAFSARRSANEGLRIYTMSSNGTACAVEPTIDAAPTDDRSNPLPLNGELIHNFDPAFAPDGTLVFASTRGNVTNASAFSYQGPQRSAADPAKPNSNLYALTNGQIRQLTYLLNQEVLPSFKVNGQLIFTAEKREPDFYQLAGRRINLDGGDYHPLFGQRPTIGYSQVTDLVELPDRNFAAVLSDRGALSSAGTIAIFNRSLGPDTVSQNLADYPVDPSSQDFPSPNFFQHSVRILDSAATGHVAQSTQGAYRNPSPMPTGDLVVSYAANVQDLTTSTGNFDIVTLDVLTGQRTIISGLDDPSTNEIWPVALYGRAPRSTMRSPPTNPNGSAVIYDSDDAEPRIDRADLTFLDFPMIASLMFQSTRGGRQIAPMTSFKVWESLPPSGVTSLDQASPFIVSDSFGKLYTRRRLLGDVPILSDGSAHLQVPGGMPILFEVLTNLDGSTGVHSQREEGQYHPGEWVTLSFRRELFNGFCGGCHGSVSGLETDVSVNPDILSHASDAQSKHAAPQVFVGAVPGADVAPPYP